MQSSRLFSRTRKNIESKARKYVWCTSSTQFSQNIPVSFFESQPNLKLSLEIESPEGADYDFPPFVTMIIFMSEGGLEKTIIAFSPHVTPMISLPVEGNYLDFREYIYQLISVERLNSRI